MNEFEFLKELLRIEYDLLGLIGRIPPDFQPGYDLEASLEKAASETARAAHQARIRQAIKRRVEELPRDTKGVPRSYRAIPRSKAVETLKNEFDPQAFVSGGNDAILNIADKLGIPREEIAC